MFSNLLISRYVAWAAAALLLVGINQILVGLFVFLSDALDIYLLVCVVFKFSMEIKEEHN